MKRSTGVFLWLAGVVLAFAPVGDLLPDLKPFVGSLGILLVLAGTVLVFWDRPVEPTMLEGTVAAVDREAGTLILDRGAGNSSRLRATPSLLQDTGVGESVQAAVEGATVWAIARLPRPGRNRGTLPLGTTAESSPERPYLAGTQG